MTNFLPQIPFFTDLFDGEDLFYTDILVYGYLINKRGNSHEPVKITNNELVDCFGISKRTAFRAKENLVKAGLIREAGVEGKSVRYFHVYTYTMLERYRNKAA